MDNDFTHIVDKEADLDIYQCLDCGAHADTTKEIVHYQGCVPGEARKWEEFYKNAEEDL